ncbi:MAG TPA: shikimate kinase AroL [Desulfobacteraceae bacterium]|nr:shikimate kinase AroL [Desulfobacteraceae bacterium]
MGPIFLIGYRCTGKTTTGKYLAKLLGRPFMDTDRLLESSAGTTITRMVDARGWDYFRREETRTLLTLDLSSGPVVATGGGIILAQENRRFIRRNGIAVWLTADAATIMDRLASDTATADSRPVFTDASLEQETKNTLNTREPLYRELASLTINTADHTPEAAAETIKRELIKETQK